MLHRISGAGLLFVGALSAFSAVSNAHAGQEDGNPRVVPTPVSLPQPEGVAASDVPDFGERLGADAFRNSRVESMDVVRARDAARPLVDPPNRRLRGNRSGEWVVPTDGIPVHSGDRAAINAWGDRSMALGFERTVTLEGLWVAGAGGAGSEARSVVAIGYRGEERIGEAALFHPQPGASLWYATDLVGIDRVELHVRDAGSSAAWYTIDDVTFAAGSERTIVTFDDIVPRTTLSGSQYAGLTWESGTGFEGRRPMRMTPAVPMPVSPAPTSPSPVPALPPTAAPRVNVAATMPTPVASLLGGAPVPPDALNEIQAQTMFSQSGTSAIPPDTHGAVGTTHVVTVVNENMMVHLKSNGAALFIGSLASFFNLGVSGVAGDPRVVYDPDSDRFLLSATDFDDTIHLAVSTTSNPAGSWFKTSLFASQGTDSTKWPDFPCLGVDQRGIYITSAMFPNAAGSVTMSIWALDKAPLVAAVQSLGTATVWRGQPYVRAVQPATHWDDAGEAYLVNTFGSNQIQVRRIVPPLTAPSLLSAATITVGVHNDGPLAPALGSTTLVESGDDRLCGSVYRDGSLWTAHSTSVATRNAIRWYELNTSPFTVNQNGTISDTSLHYYYPSIAVNEMGDALVGFSGSNATTFLSAYVAARKSGDASGQMSTPTMFQAGVDSYTNLDTFGRNRWGDYSGTTADPVDDSFWTAQSYATTSNFNGDRWSVRVSHWEYADTSVLNYCVGAPNSFGAGAVMSRVGSTSVSANDLTLVCSGMPPGEFMLFFYGDQQVQTPLSDGFLCVNGNLYRLLPAVLIDLFGVTTWSLDVTLPPEPSGAITPGSTWNFQAWYRDAAALGAGSNMSDGLQVTFGF
tara:strand:- start:7763 stop:10330 length:2568 start_codon:yes stop_codon:yes gene_type:complete